MKPIWGKTGVRVRVKLGGEESEVWLGGKN